MNLYIQEQSDDKYFQGQGKYREFFLLIFAQHAYLCFLSSQVQGINFISLRPDNKNTPESH